MVEAHGTAGNFVFAQRFPGAADRHAGQAVLDVQHQQHHQKQHDIDKQELDIGVVFQAEELMKWHPAIFRAPAELQAEKGRRWHRHAIWPAGKRQPVVEDQTDDFTKAQGHDGQVVTVHAQHRKPQNASRHRRRNGRQRQHRPETQPQVLIAQRQTISADGIERHIPQVEQPRQADHDIQPQAQQHVNQPKDDHGQNVFIGEKRKHDGNHDQQRHDPAQPRLVVRCQHMHARACGLKALQDFQPFGSL